MKTEILFPERQLKWARNVVKALGVYFSANQEQARELNFEEKKLRKLENDRELEPEKTNSTWKSYSN